MMLVGEQPGDRGDLAGHPFVGPAGQLLDDALTAAGSIYLGTWAIMPSNACKVGAARGKARHP